MGGYCAASDVAALTRSLLATETTYTTSTSPTLAQVNSWISSGCAVLETYLTGKRYSIPVASTAGAYTWLRQLNAVWGAAWAEHSRTSATLEPGQRSRGQTLYEYFWQDLERLGKMDLTGMGVSRAATGTLYCGGISISDKQLRESDTDRLAPIFGKGMFDFPGTLKPDTGNTAS